MDARTLADWIGHDHTDYDLTAATTALTEAGITDLDAGPEEVMGILAEHEKPDTDPVGDMGQALLTIAETGGAWGSPVQLAVDQRKHVGSTATAISVRLGEARHHVWIRNDGTPTAELTALHEAWEAACSMVEHERDAAWQTITREQRKIADAEARARSARHERDAAIRAVVASGETAYSVGKRLGISQQAVRKIVAA